MYTLVTCLLLVAGAMASSHTPRSLQPREDFCGTDQYNSDWYCVDDNTECCVGSVQGICMPAGYNCCDTGFYCDPSETCYLDTGIQYCIADGSSTSNPTRTADSQTAGKTSSTDSSDKDKDKDDDDSAAVVVSGSITWALMPVLGAMLVWM
ncbi:hypothetical protein G7046_g8752 [Stylonectria norvegica]|nr:hypothetical protein G7046_g8752 [Stylonectria norvegica]